MVFSTSKSGSHSTRHICCYVIIICAFVATFVAGLHLKSTTVSNFVIPLYTRDRATNMARSSKSDNKFENSRKSNATAETPIRVKGMDGIPTHSAKYIIESQSANQLNSTLTDNSTGKTNQTELVKNNFFKDRVNVVILAAMRTGSSYVGELLNKRPDFFYLFEPGLRVQSILKLKNFTESILMTKYLEMLHGMYRCNYTNLGYFLRYSSYTDFTHQQKHIPGLVDLRKCYIWRFDRKHNKTRRFCEPLTVAGAESKCTGKKNIAIKTIRIHDINLLLPLILDKEVKLKVIHLVRDPRGMVASRLMLYYHKHNTIFPHRYYQRPMRAVVEEYCSYWLRNIEVGRYVKEIRKNYMLLRYEDAATNPFGTARKIYTFLGLGGKIPTPISKWILNNTLLTGPTYSPYSTARDSKATAEHWRSKLTFELIKLIETTGNCRELMRVVGYLPVYDRSDLNKSGVSFVDNMPKGFDDSRAVDNYFHYS